MNWEKLWRRSGIDFVVTALLAYFIVGGRPKLGASTDSLVSFYDGDSTRIFIGTVIFGFAVLNLMWFGAALNSALRDAGQGGWGNAATAASVALGGVLLVLATVSAALAHSIAGSGNAGVTSALNDLIWVGGLLASYPAAMLIMSGSFGLWRAGLFSNTAFGAGVTSMVLVLAGTTAWASDGFWAPDGGYDRYISPIIVLGWITATSAFLVRRSGATARAPERAPVPVA